ncbi:L-2,4-diaminobutyrate decarboxylase [Arthrobacter saudimassiliensis]|uniref:L-2,4-diaminobutyrate decarboxylase n=1 Tax=Arthrobacter saudimassiliensis TaxID=1461584 RepID=A0A078MHK4_9MICC|nr:L-2,4-diaminobutyrate decarboxylase [Arthrobacter saudimassiliensis]
MTLLQKPEPALEADRRPSPMPRPALSDDPAAAGPAAADHAPGGAAADHAPGSAAAADQLLTGRTAERYRSEVTAAVARTAARVAAAERPFTGIRPAELAPAVDAVDLDRPLPDADAVLEEMDELYLRDAVWFHHPRYAAHLNCPVVIPALVGEAVLSAVNSSLDTWDQSAGATLMERRLIRWTADRLGLGPDADGVFTSGGSTSNLQGLLIARNHAVAGLRREPGRDRDRLPELLGRLRIFASEASHFSVQKSAALLGLGYDAVITVPTDRQRRMDPAALEQALAASAARGETPMAVVATAGTTDFGSIDPLAACADAAARHGAWLHVDAAYGGGLMTSRRHRSRLAGIEAADSVTVDYHKTFFQPVSSSALLVRSAASLGHVTYYADYLNPASAAAEEIPNQVDKSIQTTRRFDALKLWLTLRTLGPDGIGELLDAAVNLAETAGTLVEAEPDFELAAPVQLSTVVFRFRPPGGSEDAADAAALRIRRALAAEGTAMVAGTRVDGRHWLKLTLLNAEATVDDIRAILDRVRSLGTRPNGGAA